MINLTPYGRYEDVSRVMDFSITATGVRVPAQKFKLVQGAPAALPAPLRKPKY